MISRSGSVLEALDASGCAGSRSTVPPSPCFMPSSRRSDRVISLSRSGTKRARGPCRAVNARLWSLYVSWPTAKLLPTAHCRLQHPGAHCHGLPPTATDCCPAILWLSLAFALLCDCWRCHSPRRSVPHPRVLADPWPNLPNPCPCPPNHHSNPHCAPTERPLQLARPPHCAPTKRPPHLVRPPYHGPAEHPPQLA